MYSTPGALSAQRTAPVMPRPQWMITTPGVAVHAGNVVTSTTTVRDATSTTTSKSQERRISEAISPAGLPITGGNPSPINSPTPGETIVLDDVSWRSNCGPVLLAVPPEVAAAAAAAAAQGPSKHSSQRGVNTSPVLATPADHRRPSTSTLESDQRTATSASTPGMSDDSHRSGTTKDRSSPTGDHEHQHEQETDCTAHTPPRVPSSVSDDECLVRGGFSMTNSALHSMRSRSYSNEAVPVVSGLNSHGRARMGTSWTVTHEELEHNHEDHVHAFPRISRAHSYSDGCSGSNSGFVSDRNRLEGAARIVRTENCAQHT